MGVVGSTPLLAGYSGPSSSGGGTPLSPRLSKSAYGTSLSAQGSPNSGHSMQARLSINGGNNHGVGNGSGAASVMASPPAGFSFAEENGMVPAMGHQQQHAPPPAEEAMAIIGMAGRFPGANSVDAFWGNLCGAKEGITFYSEEELEVAGVAPDLLAQPSYVRAMGVLDDVFGFDAGFFHINPREAESMDPQQRIFLETAWTALEDAGYCPSPDQEQEATAHAPRIGVFAGCGQNTYLNDYCALQFAHLSPAQRHSLMTVNEKDFLVSTCTPHAVAHTFNTIESALVAC